MGTKLQGGERGSDQQADQYGVLRQLRLHVHVHLLRQGRCRLPRTCRLLQEVFCQDIAKPSSMEWGSPVDALEAALELEKTVNQSLLDMHKASDGDAHLCDFLEGEFLDEQVDAIKEISSLVTKWKRAGPGLGYH